jgi:excisionase family DNA binding protein
MFDHTSTSTPQFLTPRQLAARFGVHPVTLRRWRAEGKIIATRFGRGVRFALSEIERFERESIESFR